ncbi:hypothetical protein PVAP13_7NG302600 [Panicum virgatum]|uniref:Uncharacterized protein n=1 Tax=Panicum virgatum TaxID=38727 RepID=A0A8T0Q2X6_PANVG|nr:hypothetical protein PVAP13_7NG302600 [Panicum virgatum]
MSKVGSVTRCRICKQPGHNKSTCARSTGRSQSHSHVHPPQSAANVNPVQSQSHPNSQNALVPLPMSQQSVTSTKKRKQPCTVSTSKATKKCNDIGFLYSEKTATTMLVLCRFLC